MNNEKFIKLLKALVQIVGVSFSKEPADKDRIYLSFIQEKLDPQILNLVKSYDLHLHKQSGAFWEFEISLED